MALTLLLAPGMRRLLLAMVLSACATDPNSGGMGDDDSDLPPIPTDLPYRYYVIDHLSLPTSSAEASAMGLDLDADGDTDNKLGNVITTLTNLGIDAGATVTRSIDRGETIMLARIGTTSFQNSPIAAFESYAGMDPSVPPCAGDTDTTCRKHLQPGTSFTAAADPKGKPLRGKFEAGRLYATGGELVVRVALLGSDPIDLVLMGSKAELTMTTDTTIGQVKLAGAVSREQIDNKVIPAVHQNLSSSATADCTAPTASDCGCPSGSNGAEAIKMFDKAPVDCQITIDEVRDSSLVQALLAPDVNIDGTMALSLGVSATAVMALFSAPQ